MNHNIKGRIYAKPAHQGAMDTFTSKSVSTKDINSLGFLVNVASTATLLDASNKIVFYFEESSDDSTYVVAGSAYPDQAELNAADQIGKTTVIEYRGQAAFVKLAGVKIGEPVGDFSVVALSLHPETMPAV